MYISLPGLICILIYKKKGKAAYFSIFSCLYIKINLCENYYCWLE